MISHGLNALQIILASGFGGPTDLGEIPSRVAKLAALPEPVRLVRASEGINFKLARKQDDPVRRDTSIYRWIVESCPAVVTDPHYYRSLDAGGTFELFRRVSPPIKYPDLVYLRVVVKFVGAVESRSRQPELWLRTVVLHSEGGIQRYVRKAVQVERLTRG